MSVKIGQLSVYFGLFDEAMPKGFRATREAFAAMVGERLAEHGTVVDPGLVDSAERGQAAADLFAREAVDVVVFAPTMAAPPAWGWTAISELDAPLVVVGAQESATVPDDYDTETATARSLPVGLVMFTNVLVRRARPFTTVVGALGDPELARALDGAMRAAAAVATIRARPLAVVGAPIEGYDDVMATPAELGALGVETTTITVEELNAAFTDVPASRADAIADELRSATDAAAVPADVLQRSSRLSAALDQLCSEHDVCGGTVNCHGPALRGNPTVGVTACLGVSRLSERGVPFSCTGDVPTALLLAMGKALAGSALYCELYQLDVPGDWLLVANGGEGDMTMRAPGSQVRLLPEEHYSGEQGAGTAVAFELARGPATLASFTPAVGAAGGWILVAAAGEILDSRHHRMEGPNGVYRFSSGPVADAYARWCQAGATHHAAVLPGDRIAELRSVTELLGIELALV